MKTMYIWMLKILKKLPLSLAYLALGNGDGTITKTCKPKLYAAAMYDLAIFDKSNFSEDDIMDNYFLDLASAIRRQLGDCEQ